MKRFCLLLSCLLLLSACGPKKAELPEDFTPAYTAATLPSESGEILNLNGNGSIIVGAKYDYSNAGALYLLDPSGDAMTITPFADFGTLQYYNLLGVDGANGVWITGAKDDGHIAALRLDLTGAVTLTLDFEPEVINGGVNGFTWDDTHYYFLVDSWATDSEVPLTTDLRVYDLTGHEVFRRSISDYCLDTAGYLPREETWMEELEGREGDRLLEMLYPEGPTNEVGLMRLRGGQPAMLICRKSPIDAECYGIICPLDSTDFSIVPVMHYPITIKDGIRFAAAFESISPAYDLLVTDRTGLYGLILSGQSQALLFSWASINYPPSNLAADPCRAKCICLGPDSTLVLSSWNEAHQAFDYDILTPVSD